MCVCEGGAGAGKGEREALFEPCIAYVTVWDMAVLK